MDDKQITLELSQPQDHQGIHIKKTISISICNDKQFINNQK